jgi:acyl-CoA thioester hydrolase
MYPTLGVTADYFAASGMGGFDLEHHLWYPAEVRIGDTVVIRTRMLARSLKLFHYMMFMVNETRGVLSSLFECVHAHADLRIRHTAPFPAQVAGRIDALIAEHRALTWPAPVSGTMGLKAASSA